MTAPVPPPLPLGGAAISRRRFLQRGSAMALGAAAVMAGGVAAAAPLRRIAAQTGPTVELRQGWNSVVWWGASTDVDLALGSLPIRSAYGWDVPNGKWLAYAPNSPFRDIDTLEYPTPLWLYALESTQWQQPPLPSGLPDDQILPFGWSLVSWVGEQAAVWDVLGQDAQTPIREALRWNPIEQRFISYRPGFTAGELFAILHPGDVFWLQTIVSGVVWNPALGLESNPFSGVRLVNGQATFFYQGLHGNAMYCGGVYDRFDPTIAAATSWGCGTRLRVWRGQRFVDVVVQDTGLLPAYHVDLSEAGFQQLGDLAEGRIDVVIQVLPGPDS